MFLGTQNENMVDMIIKGRYIKGERHPNSQRNETMSYITRPELKVDGAVLERCKRMAKLAHIPSESINLVAARDAVAYSMFDVGGDSVKELSDTMLGINGAIWDRTYDQLADYLKDEGKYETLRINSEGGVATVGVACYHLVLDAGLRVEVDGMAFSAASAIAVAGDPLVIKRGATIGIHRPWTLAIGNADELREVAEFMDVMSEAMFELYAARIKSKKNMKEVKELYQKDSLLSGSEAVRLGLADEHEDDTMKSQTEQIKLGLDEGPKAEQGEHGGLLLQVPRSEGGFSVTIVNDPVQPESVEVQPGESVEDAVAPKLVEGEQSTETSDEQPAEAEATSSVDEGASEPAAPQVDEGSNEVEAAPASVETAEAVDGDGGDDGENLNHDEIQDLVATAKRNQETYADFRFSVITEK